MSEFDAGDFGGDSQASSTTVGSYELTGPPKVVPAIAFTLLASAVVVTLFSGDSVLAFALAVTSSLATLGSRVVNQTRINRPSYSSVKWFSRSTAGLYVVASLVAFAQVLMVAYVAGR